MGMILNILPEITQLKFNKNELMKYVYKFCYKDYKMKKLFLIILIFPFASYSQEGFEYIYEDTIHSGCISSFMDNQGFHISVGGTKDPNTMLNDALILKYENTSGIIIKKICKQDENIGLLFGCQKENNNYFFIGISTIPAPRLYLVELSQDLELLQEFYYSVPSIYNLLSIQDAFFDEGGIVILRGNLDDPAPGEENDIYLAKINTSGELLDTTIITNLNNQTGAETLKKLDGSGYYILGTGIHNKIVLDNDLNVIEYQDFPIGSVFNNPLALRWLPDGNIMVASMINQGVPGAYYDIRLRKVDEGFNTIKDTTFFDEGKNWPADFSSLDYVDPDNIWVVSHVRGWKTSNDEFENARVYIVDSDMNLKGAKYFAGDLDVYLYSTKALEDGGCIITGTTPKEGKLNESNAYIRKLMPDDVLTGAEETVAEDDSDVLLYPIPFNNCLHIETYRKNLSISLFNENGICLIDQQALHIPYTEVDTYNFKGGVYLYSIFYKGKVIETGKIIKK